MGHFIEQLDSYIWGIPLMVLLVATGLYLTVRLFCIQIRGFKHGIKILKGDFDDKKDPGEISHFKALTTALSATIGTGNIVGVAAAILIGGPGAVFWMWITALVGMATKYSSCLLAVHFRKIDKKGEVHGGPMHFIEMGMGRKFKWLAILYAVFTIIASFGIGNMFQINNLVVNLSLLSGYSSDPGIVFRIIVGIVIMILVGFVIIGGIKSISNVTGILVPFMCIFYFLGGIIIIILNFDKIPLAFETIFESAFCISAAAGGGIGAVIRAGVSRGLFSNEAGLGSAAMAHGAAKTKEPVREGLIAMLGPFIDTIVICTITALVIIVTDAYKICKIKGVLTGRAFEIGLGVAWGDEVIAIAIFLFAFSTLVAWSYYGDRATDYVFGNRAVIPYRIVYILFVFLGALCNIDIIINFSDAMNGLMALPNLIALIFLSPLVASLTKKYFYEFKKNDV
ncbi:MAG: sodium:alanine symporter family protein [bacterium]|nr:sodium:alanine symporter family protein [bacterium]